MCLPFQRFCCDFCDSGCCDDNEESGSVRRNAAGDKQPATMPEAPSGHGNGQPQPSPCAGSQKKNREGADVNKINKNPPWWPRSYKSSGQKDANNNGGRREKPVPRHELQAADGNKDGGSMLDNNSGEGNNVPYSSGGDRGRNDATEKTAEPIMASQQDRMHKEPIPDSPSYHEAKVSTRKMTAPQQIPQMDRGGEDDDYDDPTPAGSAQGLATSNVHGGRANGDGHDGKGDRRMEGKSWW